MMTTMVSSATAGLDPRQMMQLKANEKTAAEELKAEEQLQVEKVSSQNINVMRSSADLRMIHIQKAAEVGILRPIWLEMLEMDPDMPRTSDIIRKAGEIKNEEVRHEAEAEERAVKYEQAPDGAERAVKSEQVADGAERAVKTEQSTKPEGVSNGAERAVKTKQSVKPEGASTGAEQSTKTETLPVNPGLP